MKLLKDLIVNRKELQSWSDNLSWSHDGSLYLTTLPQVTVCRPVYHKVIERHSKQLFHIEEVVLDLRNKLRYEMPHQNFILNSQPDSYVKKCVPSPLRDLLAVLTNNGSVCIFKDHVFISELDQSKVGIELRTYHSMAWSPDGQFLAAGNETGQVVIFNISKGRSEIREAEIIINLNSNKTAWVIKLKWVGEYLLCVLDDNSIYVVKDSSVRATKDSSKFEVNDVDIINDTLLATCSGCLLAIDLKTLTPESISLKSNEMFQIIPLRRRNCAILLSNKTSFVFSLDDKTLQADTILSPHIEAKFQKWNDVFNEFNKYETTVCIYGLALSADEACLALLYTMENVSIRYRIVSENQYRIAFISLYEDWTISKFTTGLAWYQNYHIHGEKLPTNLEVDKKSNLPDVNKPFVEFLKELNERESMNAERFRNYLQDDKTSNLFKEAIFQYAVHHKDEITNPLDKACVISLANFLSEKLDIECDTVEVKSRFIAETFDFKNQLDHDHITSQEGHKWRRCSATFLPLMTTQVKVCSVSQKRMIDLNRDSLNDFGWLTRTILEVFDECSIYSGVKLLEV
ncbi:LAMI_0F12772g1_1 [Lachancea mirantina]|uniref:LAMI_0F12772g1_1 n=1 Tax=Lachancea mirantina TaxID=1230905 RepID=A0A1G4K326_9SACH|nr:LAMI_0F12772g1_1 [Lachancea mirantina]